MQNQETAESVIGRMNQLWKTYRQRSSSATMNAFVKCQQWLSNRKIAYHQDQGTGEWKLSTPLSKTEEGEEECRSTQQ